ncbi:hypothetical protein HQ529_03605 [Candidatus Woesearchaeota archaeon]|nr:hypothetical protein [Candidatus Woesearchaeota archaeon]
MKIEMTTDEAKIVMREWDKMPDKFDTFKNWTHKGTDNFKCKYPIMSRIIKRVEIEMLKGERNEI